MDKKYQSFLEALTKAKKENLIILLHRGITKKFAFDKVNLDINHNTIDQFSKKLFFYGEKSKHFWNDRLKPNSQQEDFDINDTSIFFFKYIFTEFNRLITNQIYKGTSHYFEKNKKSVSFFEELGNIEVFIEAIVQLSDEQKTSIRNYYLTILHQLGESKYKDRSHFISSSTSETVAEKFANNEIVINFWELNFTKFDIIGLNDRIPKFIGKPYKNQKELSIFTVILPQFIYSFKFEGKMYKNPAIDKVENLQLVALSGLDIRQDNFSECLLVETNYSSGVMTNGIIYQEIK